MKRSRAARARGRLNGSWLIAAAVLGTAACEPDAPSLQLDIQWAEGARPSFDGATTYWLYVSLAGGDGTMTVLQGPVRLPSAALELRGLPANEDIAFVAEVRSAAYRNGPLTHEGRTPPFRLDSDQTTALVLEAVDAPGGTDPARPAEPDLARITYRLAPWGTPGTANARFEVVGAPGAAEPGTEAIAYNGPLAERFTELGRGTVAADGAFRFPLAQTQLEAEQIHVGVRRADYHSDAADAPGLQVQRVTRTAWTASLGDRVVGSSFPNPHRLVRQRITTPALVPDADQQEPSQAELDALSASTEATVSVDVARRLRRVAPLAQSPSAFSARDAAFDPIRGRVVMWGGNVTNVLLNIEPTVGADEGFVWEWDGRTFEAVRPRGFVPPARTFHAMVYHGPSGRVVAYGGFDNAANVYDDFVAWDGENWTAITTDTSTRPPPTAFHAMTYDSDRGRVVMFGGCRQLDCSTRADDPDEGRTWEWDGQRWYRPQLEAEPPPVSNPALVYDPATQHTYMFGGMEPLFGATLSGLANETFWRYDGTTWTQLGRVGEWPEPRYGADLIALGDGRLLLIGGENINSWLLPLEPAWLWDGEAWTRLAGSEAAIGERSYAATAFDRHRQEVFVFGGQFGLADFNLETKSDLWIWNAPRWRLADSGTPGPQPPGLMTQGAAYDVGRAEVVMAAGCENFLCAEPRDELWQWNGFRWSEAGALQTAVGVATVVSDPTNGVWVIGGDTGAQAGVQIERGPIQRVVGATAFLANPAGFNAGLSAAWDETLGGFILFGGFDENGAQASLQRLDRDTNQVTPVAGSGPSARWLSGFAYDTRRQQLVVVGGSTEGPRQEALGDGLTDTWLWSAEDGWTEASAIDPQVRERYAPAMAYHAEDDLTYLFGGAISDNPAGDEFRQDLLAWNGQRWTPLALEGIVPGRRGAMPMAYDPERKELVMYGGYFQDAGGDVIYTDTWVMDASDELRPSWIFSIDLGASGLSPQTVEGLSLTLRAGGSARDTDGARVDVWNHWTGEWRPVGTTDASAASPGALTIEAGPEARQWLQGDQVRFRIAALGTGPDARTTVSGPTATVQFISPTD